MALQVLCDLVCQCVATKCVAALPSAVQKSFNPVRSKASGSKKSADALANHPFNGQFPARFCTVTDT